MKQHWLCECQHHTLFLSDGDWYVRLSAVTNLPQRTSFGSMPLQRIGRKCLIQFVFFLFGGACMSLVPPAKAVLFITLECGQYPLSCSDQEDRQSRGYCFHVAPVVDGEVTCPWRSDQRRGKSIATPPSVTQEIIITSIQPFLFSFHLSFNQHSLFITLRGLVLFITSCWVGSGGQPCCVKLRGC